MDFDAAMKISASGLTANRAWINVLSANLANVHTTKTPDGQPYHRRTVVYESVPFSENLDDEIGSAFGEGIEKVSVAEITPDKRDFKEIYDPSHPDADAQGMVRMPNISTIEEMANLVNASKSYEANLAAITTAKQLALKAMEIGK
jgi:flagellar basal-body rod protein FlgC